MGRVARSAGEALVSVAMSLLGFTFANAQSRYEYAYCMGVAGNPRVEVVTHVFRRLPEGVQERGPSFQNTVAAKFGTGVREAGCIYAPTAPEAEAKRQELIDGVTKAMGPQSVVVIDWTPHGESPPKPAPPTSTAPPDPKPATAPATPTQKPPSSTAAPNGLFVVCNGIDLNGGKLFFNPPLEVTTGDADAWSASYATYLRTKYKYDRNIACTKLATLAEAQRYYQETSDARRQTTDLNGKVVPLVITSWTYP